ncbi:MAG TPA: prepilin-type N-terminal cleavage/methylation domain-containing protein, partial [Candidatus Ozemobacteraceae bacterium]|nr:prepilin-type N-terminal cleavage/methylation domain-containing protein [Candidatus Ozemobacteraceae bacterium]
MRNKQAFTLVEIMISTGIMAMMLVSLLSFVDISAKNWQRTDQSVTLTAEGNAVMEAIRYYVENAASMTPEMDAISNRPRFTIITATGSAELNNFYIGTVSVTLQIQGNSPRVLRTMPGACTARIAGTNQVHFVSSTEVNPFDIALSRFVGTMSEHIATLTATRRDWDSMEIGLRLESPTAGEVYDVHNATPCFEATSTYFAPLLVVTTEAAAIAAKGKARTGKSGKGGKSKGRRGSGGGKHDGDRDNSDIRLKQDIVLIGHLENGLGLYRFRYIWDDTRYVGVMAQEVRTMCPDAVECDSDGYLLVDYGKLGMKLQTWDEWVASGRKIPSIGG